MEDDQDVGCEYPEDQKLPQKVSGIRSLASWRIRLEEKSDDREDATYDNDEFDSLQEEKVEDHRRGSHDIVSEYEEESDQHSPAAMSKRAEDILANAKKRLLVSLAII